MGAGAIVSGVIGGAKAISGRNKEAEARKQANKNASYAQEYSQIGIDEMLKYFGSAQGSIDDQLAFGQSMLADWEETFGGLEDNLSDYYNNLDPVKYATTYKSNLNENIDKQLQQLNENMAATGLQTAGMKQQAAKEAAFAKATGGAQADIAAEDKVRSMQQGFLNTGNAMRTNAQQLIANSYGSKANLYSNLGTNLSNAYSGKGGLANSLVPSYMKQQESGGKQMWDGIGMMGGGLTKMFGK